MDKYLKTSALTNRDINNKYTVTIREAFNTLLGLSETQTPNDKYEYLVNDPMEVAAECISAKPRDK